MDWGLKNRISQIIKPHDNRALILAVDQLFQDIYFYSILKIVPLEVDLL